MMSLYLAISGGDDWSVLAAPLRAINMWYVVVFGLYVLFIIFGLMNILTAIFVESAKRVAEVDRDLVIQDQINHENSTVNKIKRIFIDADKDGSGLLSREELDDALQDPETLAHMRILDLNVSEAR